MIDGVMERARLMGLWDYGIMERAQTGGGGAQGSAVGAVVPEPLLAAGRRGGRGLGGRLAGAAAAGAAAGAVGEC